MQELENNALFWQKADTLVLSSSIRINYPKGSCHERYPNLVYPVDYGYLSDTTATDAEPIHLYRGSNQTNRVEAIVISADILKKDCVVKFLLNCNEDETSSILQFVNQTEFQKAILVRRGNRIPSWALSD